MRFEYPPALMLANLPTPVERPRSMPELADMPNVCVKRDDLSGSELPGNAGSSIAGTR
jgi:hypothetical protein